MNKEEILEKSRKENKNNDLVGCDVEKKAGLIIAIAIAILSLVFYALGIVLKGERNDGWLAIIAVYNAILCIYKGIALKNKTNIVAGVIWGILTIACIILYVETLITTSTIL